MIKETADLYRLYVREWVTVHTIVDETPDVHEVLEASRQWIQQNLHGRVRPDDVRTDLFCEDNAEGSAPRRTATIKLLKENFKGEFRLSNSATRYAEDNGFEEYTVAVRNSRADHEIRSYGVKMLPADQVQL